MIHIRPAAPNEAEVLTRIAISSKAYWGYPAHWMEVWKPQLTLSSEYFEVNESWMAEVEGTPVGFYTVQDKNGNAWIENLWILPEYIGQDIGRQLFIHAVSRSRLKGHLILQLEADPNAQGFYEKMGMYRIGGRETEIEGQPRVLPIMEMKL